MKSLSLAIGIVVIVAALTFFALEFVLYDEDFAGSVYEKGIPLAISGFLLALIPFVHQIVSRKKGRLRFNTLPDRIVSFDAYTLPWYNMLIYGTFLVFAVSGLGIFIIWLIGLGTGFFFTRLIPILETIFVSLAIYFVTSWVGARVDRRPFLTATGTVLAYSLLSILIELSLGSDFELVPSVARLVLFLVIALFGVWRGVRARSTRYIQYLLDFLPPIMRPIVLDRVYLEVNRLSKNQSVVELKDEAHPMRAPVMESEPAERS